MSTFTKIRTKAKQAFTKKRNHLSPTTAKGLEVEHWVAQSLAKEGLTPVAHNVKTPLGEIDLIMLDGSELVFIEVRYRQHWSFGDGTESVTYAKRKRIIRSAYTYLARNPQFREHNCRFDVISVTGNLDNLKMSWIPAAFEVE